MVKYLPANRIGQDYVCGDLHGHRQVLMEKLDELRFDFPKDRLFCTGDLIDRGPDSFGTLELMFEPWFHFIRGNHDDDLPKFLQLEFPNRPAWCDQRWTYDLNLDQLEYLKEVYLPKLQAAPLVIRVAQDFWLVHSDRCEAGGYSNPAKLLDDEQVPLADSAVQQESFLWSRRLFNQIPNQLVEKDGILVAPGQEMQENVGLTFVGHNIVERPTLYRSHLFLDTGVYLPHGSLTVLRVGDVLEYIPDSTAPLGWKHEHATGHRQG
jgi:serine/threonine protein phosphatase 1